MSDQEKTVNIDDIPTLPDRMIDHDGEGLKIIDEGYGEPFDLSWEATLAARERAAAGLDDDDDEEEE